MKGIKSIYCLIPFIAESGFVDVLRYISLATGIDYKKSLHLELKNVDRINSLLGEFLFVSGDIDATPKKGFIETQEPHLLFKYGKYIYDFRQQSIAAVGYRIVLEQFLKTEPNYIELYAFMLALMISSKSDNKEIAFDYDNVSKIYTDLLTYNAFKVLTLGAFFFYKWKKRESTESKLSRWLKRALLVNMRLRSRRLVLIDSANIPPLEK